MELKDLSSEQMERARACKTPEDILALAKEVDYELSEEELACISGGNDWDEIWECPVEGTFDPVYCGDNAPYVP